MEDKSLRLYPVIKELVKEKEKQGRAIEYIYERLGALEECRRRMALKHKEAYETSYDKWQ
jgi:DNA-directed RNA polymerase subunit N (RpoN/RPB10)